MNRLKIVDRDKFVVPLAECVLVIKNKINETEKSISKFIK